MALANGTRWEPLPDTSGRAPSFAQVGIPWLTALLDKLCQNPASCRSLTGGARHDFARTGGKRVLRALRAVASSYGPGVLASWVELVVGGVPRRRPRLRKAQPLGAGRYSLIKTTVWAGVEVDALATCP